MRPKSTTAKVTAAAMTWMTGSWELTWNSVQTCQKSQAGMTTENSSTDFNIYIYIYMHNLLMLPTNVSADFLIFLHNICIYIIYRYIILNNIWVIWIHVYLWCSQNVSKFNKQHDNSSIFDPCTMNCTALTKRNKAQRLAATLSASHQLALNTVNIEM